MRLTVRYAREADITAFFGAQMYPTVRAFAVLAGERVVAVFGLSFELGGLKLFGDYRPEVKPLLKQMPVLRALQRVMQWVREAVVPVYVIAENVALVERLGFQQLEDDLYIWPKSH